MKKFYTQICLVSALIITLFLQNKSIAQTNLNVSLQVGDTTVTLRGKTIPNAQVTIKEDNAVVGTTTANSTGDFTKTLESQTSGLHEFQIHATDLNATATAVTTVSLSAVEFDDTEVTNIILPSTLYSSHTEAEKGETVELNGYGVPLATIRVFISSVSGYATTTSSASGYWTYEIDTSSLNAGDHTISVVSVTGSSYTSLESVELTITITDIEEDADDDDDEDDDDDNDSDDDSQTIIETLTGIFTPNQGQSSNKSLLQTILAYFDIDNSGKIELAELNLALRRWIIEAKGKGSGKCDLNFDNKCNLVDFSILLYYIER